MKTFHLTCALPGQPERELCDIVRCVHFTRVPGAQTCHRLTLKFTRCQRAQGFAFEVMESDGPVWFSYGEAGHGPGRPVRRGYFHPARTTNLAQGVFESTGEVEFSTF